MMWLAGPALHCPDRLYDSLDRFRRAADKEPGVVPEQPASLWPFPGRRGLGSYR